MPASNRRYPLWGSQLLIASLVLASSFAQAQTSASPSSSTRNSLRSTVKSKPSASTSDSLSENEFEYGVRSTRAKWSLGLFGQSFATENRADQAQTAGLALSSQLEMKLLPVLDFNAEASVALMTGQAQSRYGDNVPVNGVSLGEALVNIRPFKGAALSAGAVNQGHVGSPLLVSGRAFPGAIERFEFGGDLLKVELKAQQTIPTSTTMSTRVQGDEPTPSFFSEGLVLTSKPVRSLELKANGSTFRFKDLPSTVAMDSEVSGNTVAQTDSLNSSFRYEFSGWTAGGSGHLRVARAVRIGGGVQMLQNTKAPTGYRNGQTVFGEIQIRLPRQIEVTPRAEIFFNESDSSPAYYNSADYGHNNRQGFAADLDVAFKRERFRVGARFVDADLIVADEHQKRQQYLMLKLETLYENL